MTKIGFYELASKIYYTFQNNDNKISDLVIYRKSFTGHILPLINADLYNLDKTTATILCLYVNYKYYPRSLKRMFEYCRDVTSKEITHFKLEINDYLRTYKTQLAKLENACSKIDLSYIINLYYSKEINFITLYYAIEKFNLVSNSRIFDYILCRVLPLVLFLKTATKVKLEEK